jgi:hypothetical protein
MCRHENVSRKLYDSRKRKAQTLLTTGPGHTYHTEDDLWKQLFHLTMIGKGKRLIQNNIEMNFDGSDFMKLVICQFPIQQ